MTAESQASETVDSLRIPASVIPRKLHGQNFLVNRQVLELEIGQARLTRADVVLEVGPGTGNLTRRLAESAGAVVAVEIDRQFEPVLGALCRSHPNIQLIWGDATRVEWPAFNKVVANLPYQHALPLIFRFLEQPMDAGMDGGVVMVQLELAQRLCARPGQTGYGALTVALQRLGRFRLLRKVGRRAFVPPPDVESALVAFTRETRPFDIPGEDLFRRALDHLFLRRTRRLESALKDAVPGGVTGKVLGLLPRELRNAVVADIPPAGFGPVSWALHKCRVSLPPVSAETKRTAQRIFRRRKGG